MLSRASFLDKYCMFEVENIGVLLYISSLACFGELTYSSSGSGLEQVLYRNSARRFFAWANLLMTSLLKSLMSRIIFFWIDSAARALSLSFVIVFLRNVLILLSVEKIHSDSADTSGVVSAMSSSLETSEKGRAKLFSIKN